MHTPQPWHHGRIRQTATSLAVLLVGLLLPPNAMGQLCTHYFMPLANTGERVDIKSLAVFTGAEAEGEALYGLGVGMPFSLTFMSVGRWDGSRWVRLGQVGSPLPTSPSQLLVWDDGSGPALYMTCSLMVISGTLTSVVRWDGARWSTYGAPLLAGATAMTVFDDGSGAGPALHVCTSLSPFGYSSFARGIIKWSHGKWTVVGGENPPAGEADQLLAVDHDRGGGAPPTLYALGSPNTIDGVPTRGLVRLVNNRWEPVSSHFSGDVRCMTKLRSGEQDLLMVAGPTSLNGGPVSGPLQWDGTELHETVSLPPNLRFPAYMIAADDGPIPLLYIAFNNNSDTGLSAVAAIRGGDWSMVDTAILGYVRTGVVFDDRRGNGPSVHMGGSFSVVGRLPAVGLMRSTGCTPPCLADYDANGLVDSSDIAHFIAAWSSGISGGGSRILADFNLDGSRNSNDIVAFLTEWLAAVAGGC